MDGKQTETVDKGRLSLSAGSEPRDNRFTHLNRILSEYGETDKEDWHEELLAFGKEDVLLKDYFNVL